MLLPVSTLIVISRLVSILSSSVFFGIGVARELLRHKDVTRVDLVDIDVEVRF